MNLETFTFLSRTACQAADNITAESTKLLCLRKLLEVHTAGWLWPSDIWARSVQACTPRNPPT